jgi:hypothetical protein
MTRIATTFSLFAALLLSNFLAQAGSCRGGAAVSKGRGAAMSETLASGVWGGDHVRMEVGEGGVALEFDCASGEIEKPVALDGGGRFDVSGKYSVQHGGPVRRDEEANARPARYTGRVRGDTLTLKVTLADPAEDAGTYTLTRGSDGHVVKCR